ncbi:MAG: GNAT family N-acetyltransferase [Myxococcota bacterium]|nr:GNAT family N-acetyltransferase [Myxococcota bacterium]
MWSLRSVAIRTDLFLTAFDGEVIDRERYVVIRTPSNPSYWWGNYLVYPEPPDATSHRVWLDDSARELPGIAATLLAWDRPDGASGDLAPFLRDGFAIDDGTILTATCRDLVMPPRHNDDVSVAPLAGDAHWDEAARALMSAFAPRRSGTLDDLRAFVVRQLARYRAMQDAGIGQWYGAFVGGELAGTLGLVRVEGSALGRFQLVGTDPRFARLGVCSTLVHEVARRALEEQGFATLVMAADADYHAAKVYESVGFHATERLLSVIRKPPTA